MRNKTTKAFVYLALLGVILVALFMCPDSSSIAEAVVLDDSEGMVESGMIGESLNTPDVLDGAEDIAEPGLIEVPIKVSDALGSGGLRRFSSYEELKEFVGTGIPIWSPIPTWHPYYSYQEFLTYTLMSEPTVLVRGTAIAQSSFEEAWISAPDYSGTNIQVDGVGEADIVKTDGKYIYVVLEDKIVIVEAYPAEQARVLCEITLEGRLQSMYINGDRLVVFEMVLHEQTCDTYTMPDDTLKVEMSIPFHPYKTHIKIYDVSDRENPILDNEVAVDGQYWDSRMIGDYVYMVVREQPYSWEEEVFIPKIYSGDTVFEVPATDILHPEEGGGSYKFATIISVDVNKGIQDTQELGYGMFLLEYGTTVYASQSNLYFACIGYNYSESYSQTTTIHRIHLEEGMMEYNATGEIPGTVLNQFSMDEYMGYFRIVTTVNGFKHNVYILDDNLDIAGRLEDFAPQWERFHSARFMGDRCYLVTFKINIIYIDPLFVIDLSDPYLPEVLGELEITGYSDYLHPYDENHLIGIGKEATSTGLFQGVKISLFDVSDVNNPKEVAKYEIGDRGTESPVLTDHKALLFDRSRNLLAMPVLVMEGGRYVCQGAYVFHISPEEGLRLKGIISHCEDETDLQCGYNSSGDSWVKRALYIDDVLYTISDTKIGMNDLDSLSEIGEIQLP